MLKSDKAINSQTFHLFSVVKLQNRSTFYYMTFATLLKVNTMWLTNRVLEVSNEWLVMTKTLQHSRCISNFLQAVNILKDILSSSNQTTQLCVHIDNKWVLIKLPMASLPKIPYYLETERFKKQRIFSPMKLLTKWPNTIDKM